MADSTTKDDRCPHCNHKYWRNTFEVCPNCKLAPDADLGSAPPPTQLDAARAAFENQPREARVEAMIKRIMQDQTQTAANTSSMKVALWVLVVWFVLLPLIYIMLVVL